MLTCHHSSSYLSAITEWENIQLIIFQHLYTAFEVFKELSFSAKITYKPRLAEARSMLYQRGDVFVQQPQGYAQTHTRCKTLPGLLHRFSTALMKGIFVPFSESIDTDLTLLPAGRQQCHFTLSHTSLHGRNASGRTTLNLALVLLIIFQHTFSFLKIIQKFLSRTGLFGDKISTNSPLTPSFHTP